VKGHDSRLTQAISAVDKVIGEVNTQAKEVEKEVHAACEKLREMVNEREAQLLSEIETARHQKEKDLVSQKHHLEFLLVGIRESTQFGEVLVKEGSESEIVASQKEVVSRLTSLGQETERSLQPTDSTIAFDVGGFRQVGEAIEVFGSVVSDKEPKKEGAPKKEAALKREAAPKRKEASKEAAPKKKADEEGEEKSSKVLDALPPSKFNLEDWKRTVSNLEEKEAIKFFWKNIDLEGFSLWLVDNKDNPQHKKVFMSSNLIGGFFQRLDSARDYIFGSFGIFGDDNSNDIHGLFVFRGQDIPFEVQDCPEYDSYNFTKITDFSDDSKKNINAFIAWGEIGGLAKFSTIKKKFNTGKNFK